MASTKILESGMLLFYFLFVLQEKLGCDDFEALMKGRFQMSSMGELTFFLSLQVKQKADGIFISQDKYVVEILKKFNFVNVKTASTPIETQKPLVKDEEASDVDVYLYRSMIGSLMYLTTSRPDIMYLKGKPKLGLWRLISWQCKKQTIVATSTTKAKYVATASCCGQVLDAFQEASLGFRESLGRALDGTEALMAPKLFILWLATVSTEKGNEQSNFWSGQQDWKIVTWRLYESCGVCILEFEDGIVIHMLVERRYPLSKYLLQRILDLGLEVERESSVALDLIRFIKEQIDEE
ncbi:putative ribonuclease H-like domain-containing protein [Tanacetum coccineum]